MINNFCDCKLAWSIKKLYSLQIYATLQFRLRKYNHMKLYLRNDLFSKIKIVRSTIHKVKSILLRLLLYK